MAIPASFVRFSGSQCGSAQHTSNRNSNSNNNNGNNNTNNTNNTTTNNNNSNNNNIVTGAVSAHDDLLLVGPLEGLAARQRPLAPRRRLRAPLRAQQTNNNQY